MLCANRLKLLVQRIKMIVNITYRLSCLYLSFSSHISNVTYQTCNCIRRHVLQLKCTCVRSAPPLFRLGPSQDKLPLQISVPLFSCQGISCSRQLIPSRQHRIQTVTKTLTRGHIHVHFDYTDVRK